MKSLQIKCDNCQTIRYFTDVEFEKLFDIPLKATKVNKIYYGLTCSECYQSHPYLYDENNQILIDPNNIKDCDICENPIPIPRLTTQQDTNLCSIECIKTVQEKSAYRPDVVPDRKVPENKKTCPICSARNICIYDYQKKYHVVKCSKSNCTYREKLI